MEKGKFKISNGKKKDIDILSKCIIETENFLEVEFGKGNTETLINRLKSVMTLSNNDEYYLSNIIILKEYRGNNYSELLLNDVIELAKKLNYNKISLRANNENLIKFYESLGFKSDIKYKNKMIKNI